MTTVPPTPPDWTTIDVALFDMDGTLLDLGFDDFFWQRVVPARYALEHGLTEQEAVELLRPRFKAWEGRLEWYCLDHWTRELGLDIAALKREMAEHIAFLPSTVRFLEEVRAHCGRIVLVTNAHRTSLGLKLERTGLDRYLDAHHSSHDFGLPKEDPEFWRKLQAREHFDPRRALLVDDSVPVLRAARAFGLERLYEMRHPGGSAHSKAPGEFATIGSLLELLPARAASA
jgi:putative hydrolase of the HAD superfamily